MRRQKDDFECVPFHLLKRRFRTKLERDADADDEDAADDEREQQHRAREEEGTPPRRQKQRRKAGRSDENDDDDDDDEHHQAAAAAPTKCLFFWRWKRGGFGRRDDFVARGIAGAQKPPGDGGTKGRTEGEDFVDDDDEEKTTTKE